MPSDGSEIWGDGFIPRMNGRSRPGIMRALEPSDLFTADREPPSIPSVIVDARLAVEDQDIRTALRGRGIVMIVDTQAWRYSDRRTWDTPWRSAAYAPSTPFSAQRKWVHDYVFKDLSIQFSIGADRVILPSWFPSLDTVEQARDVATWILEAYEEFRRKVAIIPAIAWVPAKSGNPEASLAAAKVYAQSGAVLAAYVQRQKIDGMSDPLDRLRSSVKLMLEIQNLGLPAIAGYLGCIGLTIRALGVSAADCGPCEGQAFDFSGAIRTAIPRTRGNMTSQPKFPPVRMWIDELGQRVTSRQMAAIRHDRAAFAEIMCRRPCHRFRLERDSMPVAVHHSLLSLCETATSQSALPASMRTDRARRLLTAMRTRIAVMDSALKDENQPSLRRDHLDVQLALLASTNELNGVA